jgi:hypothetical protein
MNGASFIKGPDAEKIDWPLLCLEWTAILLFVLVVNFL